MNGSRNKDTIFKMIMRIIIFFDLVSFNFSKWQNFRWELWNLYYCHVWTPKFWYITEVFSKAKCYSFIKAKLVKGQNLRKKIYSQIQRIETPVSCFWKNLFVNFWAEKKKSQQFLIFSLLKKILKKNFFEKNIAKNQDKNWMKICFLRATKFSTQNLFSIIS